MQTITESERGVVRLLLRDSRMGVEEIGGHLGKGRNWVARVVRKLVKLGVIRAYVTVFNPDHLYGDRSTVLLMKSNPRELSVSQSILGMAELESLDGVSGTHGLLGLFRFRGLVPFEDFLNRVDAVVATSGSRTYNLIQVLTTYKAHGLTIKKNTLPGQTMAPTDWALVNALRFHEATEENPFPPSQKEIGMRMSSHLSQPAVSKAMRRLEKRGIIAGYSAEVLMKHIGLPVKFFLQIKISPGMVVKSASKICGMAAVWDLHRTGDAYNLFATVRTKDVDDYNDFLKQLYKIEGVEDTQSQISLEEWPISLRA